MAKVVPPSKAGLPEGVGRVRVSTSRARRGKILAVEHPILGWTKYKEWAAYRLVERAIDKIGPMTALSFIGLTFFYKGLADEGENLFQLIRSIVPTPEQPVPPAFSSLDAYIQSFFTALGFTPFGAIARFFFPTEILPEKTLGGEALKWWWAAVAAAITITIGKTVASIL